MLCDHTLLNKKLGVPLSQLGDASGWPRLVEQNIRDWQKIDFALAPITTAPCANLSIANAPMNALKDEGVGGLHTAPTSIIHACYEGDFLAASVSLWFHKDCDRYLQNLDRFILLAALCSIRRRAHEICELARKQKSRAACADDRNAMKELCVDIVELCTETTN